MRRMLLLASLLAASAAFATGERIALTGASDAFRDTLCISMSCVSAGPRDFTVNVRAVKGAFEVKVTSTGGQHRLTHLAPANAEGRLSSTDLVRATSLVVRAIEEGPIPSAAPAKKAVASRKARPKSYLAAR